MSETQPIPLSDDERSELERLRAEVSRLREAPAEPAPPRAEVIGARGPFSLDEERALFARIRCDVLVSKNSGSASTEPKLQVARELGLPVLLLRRPELPAVTREFAELEALWEALSAWRLEPAG